MSGPTDADRKKAREWAESKYPAGCDKFDPLDVAHAVAQDAYLAGLAAGRAEERELCAAKLEARAKHWMDYVADQVEMTCFESAAEGRRVADAFREFAAAIRKGTA